MLDVILYCIHINARFLFGDSFGIEIQKIRIVFVLLMPYSNRDLTYYTSFHFEKFFVCLCHVSTVKKSTGAIVKNRVLIPAEPIIWKVIEKFLSFFSNRKFSCDLVEQMQMVSKIDRFTNFDQRLL